LVFEDGREDGMEGEKKEGRVRVIALKKVRRTTMTMITPVKAFPTYSPSYHCFFISHSRKREKFPPLFDCD
jgi:hypothetical protein